MKCKVLFLLLHLLLFFSDIPTSFQTPLPPPKANPFSPKAHLLRFWSRLFPAVQIPHSLLTKSSPLNATHLATFSNYIDSHTLPSHILSFCSLANLFCDLKSSSNTSLSASDDANFENYSNRHFQNYSRGGSGGLDTFRTYSSGENVARDTFSSYDRDGSQLTQFTSYANNTNVAGSGFSNYDFNSNAGLTQFGSYGSNSNVQGHDFSSYGKESSGALDMFSSYSDNSNVVMNGFKGYGDEANAMSSIFSSYSEKSNIIENSFKSYNERGNGPLDQFSGYGSRGNSARNDFRAYSGDGNAGLEQFTNYADSTSESINAFRSYGKDALGALMQFTNYGNSSSPSKNEFTEYGRESPESTSTQFTQYFGNDTEFKQYFRTSNTFRDYFNGSMVGKSGYQVEAGKFFREVNLTQGSRISIPDIRDKMPKRSFLPKLLAEKLPFSSVRLEELVRTLAAKRLKPVMARTISECERPSVKGETKKCVTSIESMAEFATTVIGKTAEVSTTAGVDGWGKEVEVGRVVGRNGGRETQSVSCHQSLFPYMVYYCHAVPHVRVYDVEWMGENKRGEKKKVNDGVAICHLDTTQWSPTHAAFVALGLGPGKIEVCHWIYENDLIWVGHH